MNKDEDYNQQMYLLREENPTNPQPIYPAQKLNPQTTSQRLETFKKLKAKYGIPIEKGNPSRAMD